jgi:hypothetical protein
MIRKFLAAALMVAAGPTIVVPLPRSRPAVKSSDDVAVTSATPPSRPPSSVRSEIWDGAVPSVTSSSPVEMSRAWCVSMLLIEVCELVS